MNKIIHSLSLNLIFCLLLWSCKSPLEKIGIDNLSGHFKYQDSAFNNLSKGKNFLSAFRNLRGDYIELGKKVDTQSLEYNILMARLYSMVNFDFNNFFDTSTKKLFDKADYINIYDSLYNYCDKLKANQQGLLYAKYYLAEGLYYESGRWMNHEKEIPFSYDRDSKKYLERLNFVINGNENLLSLDTSKNKEYAREVLEYSIFKIFYDQDFNKPVNDESDINYLNSLALLNSYWKSIIPYRNEKYHLVKFDYIYIDSKVPLMEEASKIRIRLAKEEEQNKETLELLSKCFNVPLSNTDWDFVCFLPNGRFLKGTQEWPEWNKIIYKVDNNYSSTWKIKNGVIIVDQKHFSNQYRWRFQLILEDGLFGTKNYKLSYLYDDGRPSSNYFTSAALENIKKVEF